MRRTTTFSWHPSSWNRVTTDYITDIPSITLTASHDLHHHVSPRHNPHCRSMNSPLLHTSPSASPDASLQGLTLSAQSRGWRTWSWSEKRYLVADTPGALAIFDFTVTSSEAEADGDPETEAEVEAEAEVDVASEVQAEREEEDDGRINQAEQTAIEEMKDRLELEGRDGPPPIAAHAKPAKPETGSASVLIAYQRSAMFGLGSVLCWVDDDREKGTVIDGYWKEKERNMGVVAVVAEHLTVGPHRLSCELLEQTADPGGGREFRFIAVMHG